MIKKRSANLKELLPSILLSITFGFMLFIYEPIILYASNINDFWFDLPLFIRPTFLVFCLFSIILILSLAIFYIISKCFKKPIFYYIFLIIIFILFIIFYIHGNFFSQSLPTLDGEIINWSLYKVENIISAVICIAVIATAIIIYIKLGPEKFRKIISYSSILVFIMLSVSIISTLITAQDIFKKKDVSTYATYDHINVYSKNKNFLIFLLDAVDSKTFSDTLENTDLYDETFENFTYFPDTVGAYSLTRDSIPFIFSGLWDRNETDFVTYSTNAFNESPIINELEKRNYFMTFYSNDFVWNDRNALKLSNVTTRLRDLDTLSFIKQESKYILFKYLPFSLKRFSKAETIDFAKTQVIDEKEQFDWGDSINYSLITNNAPSLIDKNVFQYLHIEGAHVPYDLDENLNIIENGTYEQKCAASLKIINAYLERIRNTGIYDNSIIIIMADHGVGYVANPNPILYIKGYDEHHDLNISDKAVWYPDLIEAYNELLSGRKSTEIFSSVLDEHRDRYIIQIPFRNEDHMTEWVQKGNAWDPSTLEKTGRTFNR